MLTALVKLTCHSGCTVPQRVRPLSAFAYASVLLERTFFIQSADPARGDYESSAPFTQLTQITLQLPTEIQKHYTHAAGLARGMAAP